jgi:hypothetical protein
VCHGFAHLVGELSHGVVTGPAGLWVQAGAAGFEDVVVVVVGNYPGQQIKPGGGQDFEQMLEAGVAFSVLYGADGTTRRSSEFGQLLLGKPGGLTRLHHQRGGEGPT